MTDATVFVSTLELPDPYNTAELGAWVEYGKRKVCLTLKDPGSLYRCRYIMAWLDVTEREPWRGEPLSVWGSRRPTDDKSWSRVGFTDTARKSIETEILPLVSRYGFERWWLEVHRATKGEQMQTESTSAIVEAEKILTYHRRRAELGELWSADLVEIVPVTTRATVEELGYDMRWSRVDVAARLMFGNDHLGWMSREGKLLPCAIE